MSKLMLIALMALVGCGAKTNSQPTRTTTDVEASLATSCEEPPPPPPKPSFDDLGEGSCTK